MWQINEVPAGVSRPAWASGGMQCTYCIDAPARQVYLVPFETNGRIYRVVSCLPCASRQHLLGPSDVA